MDRSTATSTPVRGAGCTHSPADVSDPSRYLTEIRFPVVVPA